MCNELSDLLRQLIIDPSVSSEVRRQILEVLIAQTGRTMPSPAATMGIVPPVGTWAASLAGVMAGPTTRKLVYVHGICRHVAGYSDSMWHAMQPFVPATFGAGTLGQTRLEVLWSDLVNQSFAAAMAPAGVVSDQPRRQAVAEIREALRDRADQQALHAAAVSGTAVAGVMPVDSMSAMISIPGLNCIDDFAIYLTNDTVRQQILDRFINVVGPQLTGGVELDIVSHSWGTVVAYEGLRQLADSGISAPRVRNFFTVGAALSIGPVKLRLRPANQDGQKPANVRHWINLDARGDLVGGPLKGRPYQNDLDFVNLEPTGCGSFLGVVSPVCAHASYFVDANAVVNRDIFAHFILTST